MVPKFKVFLIFIFISFQYVYSQSNNIEFRSSWVITWDHINRNKTPSENMANIRKIMDDHKKANMNAVIFQVRQSGTAYYESSYEPWGYYSDYQYPGYDPLKYAIAEAHKRGLELHAWFNVFQTSSTHDGTPAALHPEWICRDQNGAPMTSYRSISPGLQEVRDYTVNVAMEIVRNYDIDGLHLDYIRWNEFTNTGRQATSTLTELQRLDGTLTDEELINLQSNQSGRFLYDYLHPYSNGVPEGFNSWEDWWRWSVTSFVETLYDSIQVVKPYVRLSAAVLGKYNWSDWQGYGMVYQDGAKWYNEGSLDHLMPMSYHWTSATGFTGMLEDNCPQCWYIFIQPGLESNRTFTVGPGSYILEENNVWYRHPEIINAIRSLGWVSGFQFFSYSTWANNHYFETAGDTFFAQKTKIPPIPDDPNSIPNPPSLTIQPLDSVTMELTIYPSSIERPTWTILYRSINPESTPDHSEIISVNFGTELITVTDILPRPDNIYQYFATHSDRYRNESISSNRVYSTLEALPDQYLIGKNYPNPFNGKTSIPFSVPEFGKIEVLMIDIRGKIVSTLVNQKLIPGDYTTDWFGKNNGGNEQASGVYIILLKSNGKIKNAKRLILLK